MQVRDLDAGVQKKLSAAAAAEGLSLSAFLRRELTRLSEQLDVRQRIERDATRNALGMEIGLFGLTTDELVARIREDRDQ